MGQCSSEGQIDPSAVSLERVRSMSSKAVVVAAHVHDLPDGRKLSKDYQVDGRILGQGLCGDVLLLHNKEDGRKYAMKTIRKGHLLVMCPKMPAEVEIHLGLDHPNIVRFHSVYEAHSKLCLLMECCEGGELYACLQKRGVFPDTDAATATRQMLAAVGYLHSLKVVHRDLKLENFLLEREDNGSRLKLIDFGFAKVWDPATSAPMTTPCGSLTYVSPDVLGGKGYTNKCDLWSLSVIVWMLLVGYPPFHGDEKKVMAKIKACEPDWSHQSRWKRVRDEALSFVKQLMEKDPQRRLSAQEAAHHPWLARTLAKRASLAGA